MEASMWNWDFWNLSLSLCIYLSALPGFKPEVLFWIRLIEGGEETPSLILTLVCCKATCFLCSCSSWKWVTNYYIFFSQLVCISFWSFSSTWNQHSWGRMFNNGPILHLMVTDSCIDFKQRPDYESEFSSNSLFKTLT